MYDGEYSPKLPEDVAETGCRPSSTYSAFHSRSHLGLLLAL
jgi:hypothetical protein